AATAYYFFEKESRFAKIIHQLKYRGVTEIGIEMGKIFGAELKETSRFNEVDLIIPVPLHWKKQKKRGYNQSEFIASGIAESMGKSIDTNTLYKAVETETQTRKSRYERWENVENIFRLRSAEKITGKHILLVDDVITTGATLESCATTLLKENNTKVSIATLAMA
ncbi:MAG: ComF family protein, partial [Bacteroidales bacterium]|nr:ComF family protein [Bacteroidales bacterium]